MVFIPHFVQNEVSEDAAGRLSAFNFCNPFDHVLPIADNAILAPDRAHLWGLVSTIPVGGVVPPSVGRPSSGSQDGALVRLGPRAYLDTSSLVIEENELIEIVQILLKSGILNDQ